MNDKKARRNIELAVLGGRKLFTRASQVRLDSSQSSGPQSSFGQFILPRDAGPDDFSPMSRADDFD